MLAVKGGPANSGKKLSKQPQRADWTCSNGHGNRGFAVRSLTAGCNERRT